MPITQDAKAVADALEAGQGLSALAEALYALPQLQGITRPVLIDIGPNVWLVCWPRESPLVDPATLVSKADEVS